MEWHVWLGVLASIVSIMMALLSWRNFAATKRIRNDLVKKMELSHLSRVADLHRGVLETLRKCANKTSIPRGFSVPSAIEEINEYCEGVSRVASILDPNAADLLNQHLQNVQLAMSNMAGLSRSNTKEVIVEMTKVYYLIVQIEAQCISLADGIVKS